MDYSHYMYLRKEIDLEKIMSREDARSSVLRDYRDSSNMKLM